MAGNELKLAVWAHLSLMLDCVQTAKRGGGGEGCARRGEMEHVVIISIESMLI